MEEKEHEITIKVSGEIDAYTAPKLRDTLMPKAEQAGAKLFVDLSEVSYMDSTGLGVLVGVFKTVTANNGTLLIDGMTERVKRLFDITGLSDVMDLKSEVEGGK